MGGFFGGGSGGAAGATGATGSTGGTGATGGGGAVPTGATGDIQTNAGGGALGTLGTLPAALAALGDYPAAVLQLTSAQIAILDTAPPQLVPAGGAGTVRHWTKLMIAIKGNGGQFPQGGGYLTPRWGIGGAATVEPQGEWLSVAVSDDSFQTAPYDGSADVNYWDLEDAENKPIVLQSQSAPAVPGGLLTGRGGSLWAPGETFDVAPGLLDPLFASCVVDTVTNSFPISAVNTGAKTFTLTGDASALTPGDTLQVYGSTGNDNQYTVASAVFSTGSTIVTVDEDIADSTADGYAGNLSIGDVGVIATFHTTNNVSGYMKTSDFGVYALTSTSGVGTGNLSVDSLDYSVNPLTMTMLAKFEEVPA